MSVLFTAVALSAVVVPTAPAKAPGPRQVLALPAAPSLAAFHARLVSTWWQRPSTGTSNTVPTSPAPSMSVAAVMPDPGPSASPDARGAAALSRIHYPWQQLGYTISFAGPRPGLLGGTLPAMHEIIAFVRPNEPVDLLAHVLAHELGHAIDKTYNTPQRRLAWLQLRGVPPSQQWFTCSGCLDFATGAGDFAETFAQWQLGVTSRSTLAPSPDPAAFAALSKFFLSN